MTELESYLLGQINSLEVFFTNEDICDYEDIDWFGKHGELDAFREVLIYIRRERSD